jgi:hypothetical protein
MYVASWPTAGLGSIRLLEQLTRVMRLLEVADFALWRTTPDQVRGRIELRLVGTTPLPPPSTGPVAVPAPRTTTSTAPEEIPIGPVATQPTTGPASQPAI